MLYKLTCKKVHYVCMIIGIIKYSNRSELLHFKKKKIFFLDYLALNIVLSLVKLI